jgi:hypothetical protein
MAWVSGCLSDGSTDKNTVSTSSLIYYTTRPQNTALFQRCRLSDSCLLGCWSWLNLYSKTFRFLVHSFQRRRYFRDALEQLLILLEKFFLILDLWINKSEIESSGDNLDIPLPLWALHSEILLSRVPWIYMFPVYLQFQDWGFLDVFMIELVWYVYQFSFTSIPSFWQYFEGVHEEDYYLFANITVRRGIEYKGV